MPLVTVAALPPIDKLAAVPVKPVPAPEKEEPVTVPDTFKLPVTVVLPTIVVGFKTA